MIRQPKHRAENRAASTRKRCTTNHNRCNRIKFVSHARLRIGCIESPSHNQSCHSRQQLAQCVNGEFDPVHTQPGEQRSTFVAATCIHVLAKPRVTRSGVKDSHQAWHESGPAWTAQAVRAC